MFIVCRPLSFVVVHCAAKTDTSKFYYQKLLEVYFYCLSQPTTDSCCVELFLHVFCNFRAYLHEALFVKSWVAWVEDYIRHSRPSQNHFLCQSLDIGFPGLDKYNFKLQTCEFRCIATNSGETLYFWPRAETKEDVLSYHLSLPLDGYFVIVHPFTDSVALWGSLSYICMLGEGTRCFN